MVDDEEKIRIDYIDNEALIFDVEDMQVLRDKYHICGTLTGVLPQFPQQNVFMGIPLVLMPEDVYYLLHVVEAACLSDSSKAHIEAELSMTEREAQTLMEEYVQTEKDQIEAYKNNLWENKKSHTKAEDNSLESRDDTLRSMSISEKSGLTYVTPNVTKNLSAFTSTCRTTLTEMPPPDKARIDIYTHLHEKGYFLSAGIRFGGQFLAYPGDPLRYHSHHIVIGHLWKEEFDVIDIVGGGRLGTAVKKCWLIGAENEDTKEYKAYSIEWAGFG